MAEGSYQVLARKYRPETFADLVGQDAMVRTLRNAFDADRIAQAFMLTGIRGTGKTTTARIIAKGMNCTGPDGTGGPTVTPCGICENCQAIARGSHVDVIEMDGASQTRIDDIRANVLDSVGYAPSQARYKIYIIDEVHMLSTSAFNALLKTLEEPPAHVKFIFATTEIRKVPVTVLSRCQRFDLRRIEPEEMMALLRRIADAEGALVEDAALALLTRAAEGSARDATSLLDQAISHASGAGGAATADEVRAMMGLADRGRVLDLFDMIMRGDAAAALGELAAQYADGADPAAQLRDLAEVTHWISVLKITPGAEDDPTLPPDARRRGAEMAGRLSQRTLGRMWQMLLKAMEEVTASPNPMMAAEMAVIRMTHVADLPPPEDLVRRLQGETQAPPPSSAPPRRQPTPEPVASAPQPQPRAARAGGGPPHPVHIAPSVRPDALARFDSFERVIDLIRARRDLTLLIDIEEHLHLVSYTPGRIVFRPSDTAPADLAQRLGRQLQAWTGARWAVMLASEGGADTIAEARRAAADALARDASAHPLVAAALEAFPGARITAVRSRDGIEAAAAEAALPDAEDDDGWDPFEDDG